MAVNLTPTAGVKIQVSADAPATFDAAGYEALDWTDVSGFDNAGESGDGYEGQNFDSLTDGRLPYRGIQDAGSTDASLADDPSDAGQIIMKAAFDAAKGSAAEKISIRRIDQNDNYSAEQALVMTWRRVYGGANDVIRRSAQIRPIPGTYVEATETP